MEHDIDLLNDEMVAAGVRVSASSKLAASSKAAVACRAPIELRRFTDGRPIERLFTAPAAGEHQPVLEETA